uniref:Carboxypeptidase n=1 Tax=Nepenthes mirabilis TaxID=150983 RepID=A0A140GML6_NEPMI|nr:putative serine carboxypeptidase type 3 [Nepenthes mirabilis]
MEKLVFLPTLFFLLQSPLSTARLLSSGVHPVPWGPKRPSSQAEALIRALNLFPREPVNIVDGPDSSWADGPRLVEKRFKFPSLDDDNGTASVEELGHHAGYYKIQDSYDARMFYFFFESRGSSNDPVVLWLTGGPGCSSELAVFYENGPFKITDNLSLVWNEYGWDQASNIIYVDQPTGTGFSYSNDSRDIRDTEVGVSNDLYDFIQAFFAAHPDYQNNDFYITGESYAGHYIPAFAARVYQGNQANEGIQINLKGFAIGNGLTEPGIQYQAYPDFALMMGLIDQQTYDSINQTVPECENEANQCGTNGTETCLNALSTCSTIFNSILQVVGNINVYDIRKQCEGSLCYNFSNAQYFLNEQSVRNALGVGDIDWVPCSSTVYQAMEVDWMRDLEVGIPALLDDGIRLLVYAGEYDLICNWLGNSRWVAAMEWSGQQNFTAAPEVPFLVDGNEAGVLTSYGPLSFLKVYNAGHMVPMDQPKAALAMLKGWIQGTLG